MKRVRGLFESEVFMLSLTLLVLFTLNLEYLPREQLHIDEGIYLTVIQDVLDGGVLYETSWEHKGPGLFPDNMHS